MKRYERTRILVEGDARIGRAMADDALAQMGEEAVSVVEGPRECLVMVQVRETARGSRFYLGEALATTCRVRAAGFAGMGLVLGSQPDRARDLAVIDAAFGGACGEAWRKRWDAHLAQEAARLAAAKAAEAARVRATRVDFSTMKVES